MTTRRDVLAGMGALAIGASVRPLAAAVGGGAEPLPDYWKPYLDGIAAKIKAHDSADAFYFLTDVHFPSNNGRTGQVIAYLAERTAIRRTIFGGDIPEAFSQGRYATPKDGLDVCVREYRARVVAPVERAGQAYYAAKGNHDFTMLRTLDDPAGYTYDGMTARAILMGTKAAAHVVTNADDPECCYYYFDNAAARTRYIVADTTDKTTAGEVSWGVETGMGERQLNWIAERALTTMPDGYAAVVVHHIPVAPLVSLEEIHPSFNLFRRMLEAYQARGRIAVAGREHDFS